MPTERVENAAVAGDTATPQRADMSGVNTLAQARAALDARLRAELRRRLTLAVMRQAARPTEDAPGATFAAFQAEIATYQEVRQLLIDAPQPATSFAAAPHEAWWDAALRDALRMDADAILVWRLAAPTAKADDAERAELCALLAAAERLNVFETATLALVGPGVTREQARALGYEDGFALAPPLADAVHSMLLRLTREALARAEYRHKGSSPPCNL